MPDAGKAITWLADAEKLGIIAFLLAMLCVVAFLYWNQIGKTDRQRVFYDKKVENLRSQKDERIQKLTDQLIEEKTKAALREAENMQLMSSVKEVIGKFAEKINQATGEET